MPTFYVSLAINTTVALTAFPRRLNTSEERRVKDTAPGMQNTASQTKGMRAVRSRLHRREIKERGKKGKTNSKKTNKSALRQFSRQPKRFINDHVIEAFTALR